MLNLTLNDLTLEINFLVKNLRRNFQGCDLLQLLFFFLPILFTNIAEDGLEFLGKCGAFRMNTDVCDHGHSWCHSFRHKGYTIMVNAEGDESDAR